MGKTVVKVDEEEIIQLFTAQDCFIPITALQFPASIVHMEKRQLRRVSLGKRGEELRPTGSTVGCRSPPNET